jgi:hypothetical protein
VSRGTDLLETQGVLNKIEPANQQVSVPGRSTVSNSLHDQVVAARSTDIVSSKKEFLAVVLRDENRYLKTAPAVGSPQHLAPDLFAGDSSKTIKVKAAIPEIHTSLPSPLGYEDHMVIGLYPTFVCSADATSGRTPAVGEVIRVSFGDLATQSNPTILGLTSSGNKQSGAQTNQSDCGVTAKTAMRTVPPTGSSLNTPALDSATSPDAGSVSKMEKNIQRAIRVSKKIKEKTNDEVPVEILLAFMEIESKGDPSALRFEPHIFVGKGASWMSITGKVEGTPKRFKPRRGSGMRKVRGRRDLWGAKLTGVPYTRPKKSPYYSRLSSESNKAAFEHAMTTDPYWAVYSTSFGTYQVMGFNLLTNTSTKFAGKTPEEFYNAFKENPEQASDEMIVSWISAKKSWRRRAKRETPLAPDVLKTLIKLYNGNGQVDAYYYRIGGGLKKSYEQAIKTMEAYRRQELAVNPPPPEPINPARQIKEHKKEAKAKKIADKNAETNAAATCVNGGELPTSLAGASTPTPENVRGGERPDNHSNKKPAACGQSARLGDTNPGTQKKDSETGETLETDEAFIRGRSLGKVAIKGIKTHRRKKHPFVVEIKGIRPRDLVEQMINSARKEGIELQINSGFRTNKKQKELYDKFKRTGSPPTARPGRSKHQSGTAVDFQTGGGTSKAYFWLVRNAIKFGFIRTVRKETWHWVYKPNINDIFKYVPKTHTKGKGAWPSFVKEMSGKR